MSLVRRVRIVKRTAALLLRLYKHGVIGDDLLLVSAHDVHHLAATTDTRGALTA